MAPREEVATCPPSASMIENSRPQEDETVTFGWRMQFLSRVHFHACKDSPVKLRKLDAKRIKISSVTVATLSFLNLEVAIEII